MLSAALFPDKSERLLDFFAIRQEDEPEAVLFKTLMRLCALPEDAELEWPGLRRCADDLAGNYQGLHTLSSLDKLLTTVPTPAGARDALVPVLQNFCAEFALPNFDEKRFQPIEVQISGETVQAAPTFALMVLV